MRYKILLLTLVLIVAGIYVMAFTDPFKTTITTIDSPFTKGEYSELTLVVNKNINVVDIVGNKGECTPKYIFASHAPPTRFKKGEETTVYFIPKIGNKCIINTLTIDTLEYGNIEYDFP